MVAHATLLRAAGANSRNAGPLILKRIDDNVVAALLDDLADHGGLASVIATRSLPAQSGGALTLFQPVHRVFQVALLEVVCDQVGTPRLDPAKIDSAGMVLRRRTTDAVGHVTSDQLEGWMQEAPTPSSRAAGATKRRQVRGWLPFSGRVHGQRSDLDLDPDPSRRVGALGTGRPEIDLRLLLARGNTTALRERVIPLFPVPPEVCEATGKTLLYGLIPLAGGEQSELPEEPASFNRDELSAHMPQILRGGLAASIPKVGDFLALSETKAETVPADIALFTLQLRQIAIEMDAFGTSPESLALRAALDAIDLTFFDEHVWPNGTTDNAFAEMAILQMLGSFGGTQIPMPGLVRRSAATFLGDATRVLLEGDDRNATVRMPIAWPVITPQQASRIVDATQQAMRARIKTLVPRTPQFSDAAREYRLRAFVRVRDDDGCPPSLAWSDYSEAFTIAPWYAPSDAPPALIPLPDIMDRSALKKLKPNVSFAVPKKLADFLNGNSPADLAKGKGNPAPGGIDLGWICSFSIPIITLCAFIVLNIFLSLFDLIFNWMMFIKICIPIPRKSS